MEFFKRFILSRKHKNSKVLYYTRNYLRQIIPSSVYPKFLSSKLSLGAKYDRSYILKRVDYYNKLEEASHLTPMLPGLDEFKKPNHNKVYFFDSYEYVRYFNRELRANFLYGDITHVPEIPSITKSRPVRGNNANSIVLNLDKVRHFTFVKDSRSYTSKKNMLIGRSVAAQPHRIRFLEMYFGHPMCNVGQINDNANSHKWKVDKISIEEHLDYKFILCLEGNDVATNLKWVMSSNSLAVMPKPTYETWFMEGTLIPNFHYVEIKPDFSDLEERMNYYILHPEEAEKIIKNAHDFISQFMNKEQEDLISLLVLKKYFEKTGQL